MKVIVIGGVAAGMSAASKIKRMDAAAQITVYEKGNYVSYGACGLPYYVGGSPNDYRLLVARTPEEFREMGIEVHLGHEVVSVDFIHKAVRVKNTHTGNEFEDSYDKLMIGTGAGAVLPPIEGLHLPGVYTLKTLEDGIKLRDTIRNSSISDITIIGGGPIGIECADVFLQMGKTVRIIEAAPRILNMFDEEIANLATQELQKQGVKLLAGEKVERILGTSSVTAVQTQTAVYPTQLVVLAVGVRPATQFLKDSGLELARNGSIVVDTAMHTSIADVYAAGDCALCYDRMMQKNIYLALATVANKCGKIAGANIAGANHTFNGALSSACVKICGIEALRTGLSEQDAKQLGKNYKTVLVTTPNHASYYPNATPILIKLVYEAPSKIILGAQLCGEKDTVIRGNIFSVAIHAGMTTEELGMVDFAYAPPFSTVWDAVQIACNAAK